MLIHKISEIPDVIREIDGRWDCKCAAFLPNKDRAYTEFRLSSRIFVPRLLRTIRYSHNKTHYPYLRVFERLHPEENTSIEIRLMFYSLGSHISNAFTDNVSCVFVEDEIYDDVISYMRRENCVVMTTDLWPSINVGWFANAVIKKCRKRTKRKSSSLDEFDTSALDEFFASF